ncbi:MAG: TonB-dependent receptor [Rhodocyclaceae bacterium]|nr:TonB-dependent receptor [Rhodocyclaceae bacterium]
MASSSRLLAGLTCLLTSSARAAAPEALSEQDFLRELPEVLTVTRLAQPLDEVPGAVTILDRETLRRSGARTVAEALRLVPGFIFLHKEGIGQPIATYHAEYEDFPRRLQVFIDGRSVYSSLATGTATHGMLGVVIEDIERIEVLRGSNSAAYGANAFLGVVNVVTRHAADTQGGLVRVEGGEAGLAEGVARVGWGKTAASWRLSASKRRDGGFPGLNDGFDLEQAHLRGDLIPSGQDELQATAGYVRHGWHTHGLAREEGWSNVYARLGWKRQLDRQAEFRAHALYDEERYENYFPRWRADGTARRLELEASHSFAPVQGVRLVWGGQYRHEEVTSPDLFASRPEQRFDWWRFFANAEWKPHPRWVVNAGALWEHHSIVGARLAPRLMINHHLSEDHTLRAGATTAYRMPTLFELRADWRNENGVPQVLASGKARPEVVDVLELGYLGQIRPLGLVIDVRRFQESAKDLLRFQRPCPGCPNDFVNKDPSLQNGWEVGLRWQPTSETQFLVNYTVLHLLPAADNTNATSSLRAPNHIATIAWFQRLPQELELSLIYTALGRHYWVRPADMIPAWQQTDLRLARKFRLGATRAEAALFVRAIDGGHIDYALRGLPPIELNRRAALSLRLEF